MDSSSLYARHHLGQVQSMHTIASVHVCIHADGQSSFPLSAKHAASQQNSVELCQKWYLLPGAPGKILDTGTGSQKAVECVSPLHATIF